MAEALALVGGVSSILQIISSVTKLAKSLNEVRESYNNVALNITLVASKLSTIRLALEALHKWRASDTVETEASIQLDEDLGLSLSCCAILITVIEGKLAESGYTPGLTLRHKMKYVWLEDILKEYVSNLEGQVQALQLLLTIFQCRTATEQRQELAKTESRNIIELVRAETMTLGAAESELDDAMSILSHDHSVHLDVESIIMKSPAYRRVYGERESSRRKKTSGPPPPPPPRRKPLPKLSPSSVESNAQSILTSPGTITSQPQPPSVPIPELSPPPEIAPQPPPIPPRPKTRSHRRQNQLQTNSSATLVSQGRINVWDFLGPDQEGQVHSTATMVMADSAPVFELSADEERMPMAKDIDATPNIVLESFSETDETTEGSQNQAQPDGLQLSAPKVIPPSNGDGFSGGDTNLPSMGVAKSERKYGSNETLTPLEGFKNQLDLAFEDRAPAIGGRNDLSLSLDSARPSNTSPIHEELPPTSKEQEHLCSTEIISHGDGNVMESDHHDGEDPSKQDVPKSLSIRSSIDMYDASVRHMPIGDSAQPASLQSSSKDERTETINAALKFDNVEVKVEGPSILNQQRVFKQNHTEAVNDTSPQRLEEKNNSPQVLTGTEKLVEDIERKPKSSPASPRGLGLSPQNITTSTQDEVHSSIHDKPSIFTREPNSQPSPARAPPPPPARTPSIPPISISSPPSFDQSGRDSGLETSTISSRRDSSVFEESSIVSSSGRSIDNTIPTAQSTMATSVVVGRHDAARDKAQADLRRLQTELTAAKARGDSQAAQVSLQKSIDVIRRTYLSTSTPVEAKKTQKLRDRASFIRFPSLSSSSNGSALGDAAAAGDLDVVRAFLDARVNVDARGSSYMTPLMRAAMNDSMACLDLLKERGADEFAVDARGRSVLHLAVTSNHLLAVQWLLKAYPPPRPQQLKHRPSILSKATDSIMSRAPKNLRETSDSEGSKPLHVSVGLDQNNILKALLIAGVDIESRNNWGRTSLHEAIISNRRGVFDILLAKGAKINAVDGRSMTPLHWAMKTGHVDMAETLLMRGASRSEYDIDGNQPVHQAAWVGQVLSIEALVAEHQDLEVKTKAGESLLHIACLNKNSELANYLLGKSVDVNSWARPQSTLLNTVSSFKVPLTSLTPLLYACCKGDYEMALLLLDHEAWLNAATPEGVTALMMATETEDTNMVNLLLTRGAKVNANMPGTLTTALHIAARRGDLETVQQLCRSNANMSARTSGGGGNYGRTPGEEVTAKCSDKVKRGAVEDYFKTIRENRFRNSRVRVLNEQAPYQAVGPASRNGSSFDLRPSHPISYAPWGQHNVIPIQGVPYGYQPAVSATYPIYNQPVPAIPEHWYDPNPFTHVESPPPYQPGSSVSARLASQAPVHRPGDTSGPKYA